MLAAIMPYALMIGVTVAAGGLLWIDRRGARHRVPQTSGMPAQHHARDHHGQGDQ